MWKLPILLAICLIAAEAFPQKERIVGGTNSNINSFPFAVVLLISWNNAAFRQDCGGSLLNNRSVVSASHCWAGKHAAEFRCRLGSTFANSGGAVHNVQRHITHPNYVNTGPVVLSDIGIVRLATAVVVGGSIRLGSFAGPNFHIPDNTNVWAIGWGIIGNGRPLSEHLQQVQLRIIGRARCTSAFNANIINAATICAGWDTTGRGTCSGDSGSPLVHNGVSIGVLSFGGTICGDARWPSVYARVSSYINWIRSNA